MRLTNAKALYVVKEEFIFLLSVGKETALNKQQTKSCVPLQKNNLYW